MKRVVVVGGGAGGLELVAKLGRKYRKNQNIEIVLVDSVERHLWKPLLHEVATGSMEVAADALEYRTHAHRNGYVFRFGDLIDIDRENKRICLAPLINVKGEKILSQRYLSYDYLVMAVGSISNNFGTPGVAEHCRTLDRSKQAVLFHTELMEELIRFSGDDLAKPVSIAIVGGGATGVELSAELHHVVEELEKYLPPHLEDCAKSVKDSYLKVTLIEAGPRILPPLPERISTKAHAELENLGVDVRTATMITEANAEGFVTKEGELIPACLKVWAAGIKGADFLKDIGGLETNRINQLVVNKTLQTSRDANIFALGDCASFEISEGLFVPPRAQSAHQMAMNCFHNLDILLKEKNKELKPYHYSDKGSLVNLAKYQTLGAMAAPMFKNGVFVEGVVAKIFYVALYRMHQIALHGYIKTGFLIWYGRFRRAVRRMIKLH